MDKNLKENQVYNYRVSTSGGKVFPEKKANPLSLLSFSWMNDFVSKGQKNRLLKDDLYNIPKEQESSNVGSRFIEIWNREKALEDPKTQWGLHKSIFIFSRAPILLSGFLDLIKMIAGLLSPFILQQFLDTYQIYQDKNRKEELGEYGLHLLVIYCFAM